MRYSSFNTRIVCRVLRCSSFNFRHGAWAPAQQSKGSIVYTSVLCTVLPRAEKRRIGSRPNTGGLAYTRWKKQGVGGKCFFTRANADNLFSSCSAPSQAPSQATSSGWNSSMAMVSGRSSCQPMETLLTMTLILTPTLLKTHWFKKRKRSKRQRSHPIPTFRRFHLPF